MQLRARNPGSMFVTAKENGAMPWSREHFPASMRHLSEVARAKAVEIANALLAEGMDEGRAIRIAIAKAEEWARRRGLPARDDGS